MTLDPAFFSFYSQVKPDHRLSRSKVPAQNLPTMTSLSAFIPFLSLLLFFLPTDSQASSPLPTTAHAELNNRGFPIGLLPANVLDYTINGTTGDFSVNLSYTCKVTLPPDNYLATYSKLITGKIVAGKIAELDGIRVRALLRWWSISGIKTSGDDLVFEVGMVSAKYPSKNFNESLECDGNRSSS